MPTPCGTELGLTERLSRRFVTTGMTATLLLALCLSGQYKEAPGPYKAVTSPGITLDDRVRDKDLEVRVTFPAERGTYPIIVFSHGMGGSKDAMDPLVKYWASHGYVVIQPTHSDSLQYATLKEKTDFMRGKLPRATDWKNRPADVSFVLDSVPELERRVVGLQGKPDMTRIGVAGHSYGAHTSMLIGGTTARSLRGPQSYRDKRVKAIMPISPQGRGGLFNDESWKGVTIPMMVVSGTEDRTMYSNDPPESRIDPYLLAPAGDKYLIWIEGANHGFGGIVGSVRFPGSGPDDPAMVSWIRIAGAAFFDAYLKQDARAKAYLGSDDLETFSGGKVDFRRK